MADWGDGRYELTAKELEPTARALVETARVRPGEAVLDLGCGTGNVALLAAARGARVVGVDPARRLVDVTAGAARDAGHDIVVKEGRAEAIPAADGSFDLVLSHFAIIFCGDEEAAMSEVRRVLGAGGRFLFTAWVAAGAVHEAIAEFGRAMEAVAPSPSPPRFAWRDPDQVRALVARHFANVEVSPATTTFAAPSAEAFTASFLEEHPMGIPCAAQLGAAGTLAATTQRAVAALRAASESTAELRVASPYVTIQASN
jgi:ubiquinone/menaquinone biosynthesis C-methylase UbiE